jgi:MFS family permease
VSADVRTARGVVTLVFFLNGAGFAAWAARIPAVRDRLELTEASLGLALAMIAVGSLVAMPLSGWLSARWGSRRTTRIALSGFALALPLLALAPSYLALVGAALVAGAFMGSLDVAMNAHGVAVERHYPRPILSAFHAAFSLGALVGAAASAGIVALDVDVRVHLAAAGVLVLALGVPATRRLLPAGADRGETGAPVFVRPPRALWALGLIAFAGLLAEGAATDWSALYVTDALESSAVLGALTFAFFQITMTVGRLVGDRVTAAVGPVALLRGGGLIAAVGLAGALVVAEPVAAFVGFACLGAGLAVVVPVVFRAASEQPGLAPGPGLAAVSTMGYLGFLAGPPLIGALASATSLSLALGLVVALVLLQASLAGHARPRPASRPTAEPVPA